MENAWIAERLEAFAALLELAEANPYQPRAYRRAADTIRAAPVPVAELVRRGRVRDLRGIGRGIEGRLRELVETGDIAELAELERELAPGLVGLGRYLGLTARRSVDIARALGVQTPDEFRAAAAAGRLRDVPGVGPKLEAQLLDALAREAERRPPRGLLLNQARELVGGIAELLGGEAAGDVRRWRDSCERLAGVGAAAAPPGGARPGRRRAPLPARRDRPVRLPAADRGDDRAGGAARGRADGRGHPRRARGRGARAVRDRAAARRRRTALRRGPGAAARRARRGGRVRRARRAVVAAGAARGAAVG